MHSVRDSLKRAYQDLYNGPATSDSPELSQLQIAKRIAYMLLDAETVPEQGITILNLGSGEQPVEKKLVMLANSSANKGKYGQLKEKLRSSHIITLDIAAKAQRNQPKWLDHIMADSTSLPIRDNSVDLVVSNHSIDMLRREEGAFEAALGEVERVLAPEGTIIFNYHHADLFDKNCVYFNDRYPNSPQAEYYDPTTANPFYEDSRAITEELVRAGLFVDLVDLESDHNDSWWRVEAVKELVPSS